MEDGGGGVFYRALNRQENLAVQSFFGPARSDGCQSLELLRDCSQNFLAANFNAITQRAAEEDDDPDQPLSYFLHLLPADPKKRQFTIEWICTSFEGHESENAALVALFAKYGSVLK